MNMIQYNLKPFTEYNLSNEICIILKKDNSLFIQLSNGEITTLNENMCNLEPLIKSNRYLAVNDCCVINLKNIRSIKKAKTFCLILTKSNFQIHLKEKYHNVLSKIADSLRIQGPNLY